MSDAERHIAEEFVENAYFGQISIFSTASGDQVLSGMRTFRCEVVPQFVRIIRDPLSLPLSVDHVTDFMRNLVYIEETFIIDFMPHISRENYIFTIFLTIFNYISFMCNEYELED